MQMFYFLCKKSEDFSCVIRKIEEFDRKKKGEKGAVSNAIIINAALE